MTKTFWENVSQKMWDDTPYPWKPGYFDLAVFGINILKIKIKYKTPKILLIGATKELRYILSLFKIKYDVIDYSPNMVKLTSTNKKDSIENYYNQNWNDTLHLSQKYNLILGDLILNLLDKDSINKLLEDYKKTLTENGYFLLRTRILTQANTSQIEKVVYKQLNEINNQEMYTVFANIQTFKQKGGDVNGLLESFIQKEINGGKRNSATILLNRYLNSGLSYFIYPKSFFTTKPNIEIVKESKPYKYLDSFVFIKYKPEITFNSVA